MNQAQRDELRAKHRLVDYRHGADYPKCGYCNLGEWPCDVIRVLDWAEGAKPKCEHITKIVDTAFMAFGVKPVTFELTYCTKCGEKL